MHLDKPVGNDIHCLASGYCEQNVHSYEASQAGTRCVLTGRGSNGGSGHIDR